MSKPQPKQIVWIEGNKTDTGYIGSRPVFTIMEVNTFVASNGEPKEPLFYVYSPMSLFRSNDGETFSTKEAAKTHARLILAGVYRWLSDIDELNV